MMFPLKIVLGPQKTRILYFTDENRREEWFNILRKVSGNADFYDFYELKDIIGKG